MVIFSFAAMILVSVVYFSQLFIDIENLYSSLPVLFVDILLMKKISFLPLFLPLFLSVNDLSHGCFTSSDSLNFVLCPEFFLKRPSWGKYLLLAGTLNLSLIVCGTFQKVNRERRTKLHHPLSWEWNFCLLIWKSISSADK